MPRLSDLVQRSGQVEPNRLAGLSRDQMAVQEVMREVERRNAELQSGAPQRRSFGFAGDEGAMFDENDYQSRLATMANPRTITNDSIAQDRQRGMTGLNSNPNMPQNYIQRTGGEVIDVGPSAKEMRVFGLPALMDEKRGMVTIYHKGGMQENVHINDIRAEEERRRQQEEMADLPRRMALAKLREQEAKANGGGLSPADQLAREKFEWEKTKGGENAGPKLTEGQAKATTFASQMAAASNELDKLESGGFDPNSLSTQLQTKMAGGLGNIVTSPKAQQAKQTQNQWSEAFLRVKTGAAATEPEVELNNKTFFPQLGDSKEVIDQKRRMRVQAEQDVLNMTGGGRELATQRQAPQQSGSFDADKESRYQAWKAQQGR